MDAEKFWSTTEMNKFLYQQLKTMCEANGFVLSPRKGKHLVKIAEHFVQIVCPEVSYGRTRIHVLVSPAGSFANHIYAEKVFCPHGDKKEDIYSVYYDLAIEDATSYKEFYDIQQMKTLWAEIIEPQFDHEIFSCLNAFSFLHFLNLSESWSGDGFKKGIELNKQSGREISVDVQENYDTVQEVLSMIQRGDAKAQIIDKMQEIERIALNKAWGVMLSPEGKTVRLKKKELL